MFSLYDLGLVARRFHDGPALSVARTLLESLDPVRIAQAGWVIGQRAEKRSLESDHSGMLPCFFGGSVSRLLRSACRALATWARVSEG